MRLALSWLYFLAPANSTALVWEKIKDGVLAELQRVKIHRLKDELLERQQHRAGLLRPLFLPLGEAHSDDRGIDPPFKTFLQFGSVKPLWMPDDAQVDEDALFGEAYKADLEAFRRTTTLAFFHHLAEALAKAGTPLPASLLAKLDPPLPPGSDDKSPPSPTITDDEMNPYFARYTARFSLRIFLRLHRPLQTS